MMAGRDDQSQGAKKVVANRNLNPHKEQLKKIEELSRRIAEKILSISTLNSVFHSKKADPNFTSQSE